MPAGNADTKPGAVASTAVTLITAAAACAGTRLRSAVPPGCNGSFVDRESHARRGPSATKRPSVPGAARRPREPSDDIDDHVGRRGSKESEPSGADGGEHGDGASPFERIGVDDAGVRPRGTSGIGGDVRGLVGVGQGHRDRQCGCVRRHARGDRHDEVAARRSAERRVSTRRLGGTDTKRPAATLRVTGTNTPVTSTITATALDAKSSMAPSADRATIAELATATPGRKFTLEESGSGVAAAWAVRYPAVAASVAVMVTATAPPPAGTPQRSDTAMRSEPPAPQRLLPGLARVDQPAWCDRDEVGADRCRLGRAPHRRARATRSRWRAGRRTARDGRTDGTSRHDPVPNARVDQSPVLRPGAPPPTVRRIVHHEPELPPPPPPPPPPPLKPPLDPLDDCGGVVMLAIEYASECTRSGPPSAACGSGMLLARIARSHASAASSATAHALYSRNRPCPTPTRRACLRSTRGSAGTTRSAARAPIRWRCATAPSSRRPAAPTKNGTSEPEHDREPRRREQSRGRSPTKSPTLTTNSTPITISAPRNPATMLLRPPGRRSSTSPSRG